MTKLEDHCRNQLRTLAKADLQRTLKDTTRSGVHVVQNGKKYVSFSCNDYLGLANEKEVVEAARAALDEYGVGAGASRLITGNHPLYAKLEKQLAKMKKTESALVFGSGYLANLGIIPALIGTKDIIFADKLIHACLLDGALLSGANFKRFRHNDAKHLETLLIEHRDAHENALILVDHVYSMDGDIAPLAELSKIARAHDAWLMVDDAHGFGLVESPVSQYVDIWMGTLSKTVGAYGGYVAGKKAVIDLLVSRARSLIFSTGLPPAICAAAYAALEIMQDEPRRKNIPLAYAEKLCDALKLARTNTTIVPIILGETSAALEASEALKKHGFLVTAIRPPAVPQGSARLRVTFSNNHTQEQVDGLIEALLTEKIRPVAGV